MGGFKPWHLVILLSFAAMVLVAVAVVVVIVVLVSRRRGGSAAVAPEVHGIPSQGPDARQILDRRLATGEITREQYEELRHTLE